MNASVRLEVAQGIATISLNRPEVMNAMDGDMMRALREAAEQVEHTPAVRAVVVRGEGPAFLAGGDVRLFHANLPRLPQLIVEVGREFNQAILALRRMAKPVLASVHGAVAGAGVSLMAACDLAIAADDTRFNLAYSRIGTNPDGGATWFLPRMVGERKAMELALMSENLDAAAALDLGLINWISPAVDLAAQTQKLAQRLAQGPTVAYGAAKALIHRADGEALAAHLEAEIQAFSRCARTRDLAEGVTAFVEKRTPVFKGE